jgi:uncharacterized protein (TIGR02246 family)
MTDTAEISLACANLIVDMAEFLDAGDVEGMLGLYADDAVVVRADGSQHHGQAAIRAAYTRPAERRLHHLVTNVRILVHAPDRAEGISRLTVYSGTGAPDAVWTAERPPIMNGVRDEFVRAAIGWRIARRTIRAIARA